MTVCHSWVNFACLYVDFNCEEIDDVDALEKQLDELEHQEKVVTSKNSSENVSSSLTYLCDFGSMLYIYKAPFQRHDEQQNKRCACSALVLSCLKLILETPCIAMLFHKDTCQPSSLETTVASALRGCRPPSRQIITPIAPGFAIWTASMVIQITPKFNQLFCISFTAILKILSNSAQSLLSNGRISYWIVSPGIQITITS